MPVAIIGHGKSPVGRGWGERIDACDTVLRFWNCHWQEPEDHGTRYDIGFFEIHAGMMADFNRYRQHEPARQWVGSILGHVDRRLLPERLETVDQSRWVQIGMSMGGRGATGSLAFTRGTIAALWAIENAAEGEAIVLVGFDNVYGGVILPIDEGFPQAYVDDPGTLRFDSYAPGETKHGNHDFGIERPLLEKMAAIRGVRLEFSQDVWGCG